MIAAALLASLFAAAAQAPAAQPDRPAPTCDVGPVDRTFGGAPWQVWDCDDGRTLALSADARAPAFTSSIFLTLEGDRVAVHEAHGGPVDEVVVRSTIASLNLLTPADLAALRAQAAAARRRGFLLHRGPSGELHSVRIRRIDTDTPESGIVEWWHRWTVETQDGARMDLYSISLAGPGDRLPQAGQVCDIRYHMEHSDGVTTDGPGGLPRSLQDRSLPEVETFACPPGGPFVAPEPRKAH